MPDAAKAKHLNWGLEAELYRRTALAASLETGKFSMQVRWPFVKWPRDWLDPKEHRAPSWTLQPSPHLPHFLPRATPVHLPSPRSPSASPYPGVMVTGDRWPKICAYLYGIPSLSLSNPGVPVLFFSPERRKGLNSVWTSIGVFSKATLKHETYMFLFKTQVIMTCQLCLTWSRW